MTIHEAQQQLLFQLYHIYDNREAAAIAGLVMENITGWKKIDRIINKTLPLSQPKIELLKKYTGELLSHRPIQYVLGEAWFYGMKFYVNESVLIPRPETEELVAWVIKEAEDENYRLETILDIGTGSGCIPVALKKKLPFIEIYSCDISNDALEIAHRNAGSNDAVINFLHLDFLDEGQRNSLPSFDYIVSNPPYIPIKDKSSMPPNVVNYEPHLALFVADDDPLIFYKAIADFAKDKLTPRGKVFIELHEESAADAGKIFSAKALSGIETRKDMQGKDRMLKATMLL